jgi:hypothetical protein
MTVYIYLENKDRTVITKYPNICPEIYKPFQHPIIFIIYI